jgi:crossover junction endodeoxyribonuclease RuvC
MNVLRKSPFQNSAPTVVIGIDPGYGRVGWCVGEAKGIQLEILEFGCIETSEKLSLMNRYTEIQKKMRQIIEKWNPDEAALESLFFSKNQTTAMHVSEARGLIIGVLLNRHIRCFDYTPLQIKQSVTGFGKADKTAVERMLRLQFHLGHEKILDDAMDAIGVTLTHTVSRNLKRQL